MKTDNIKKLRVKALGLLGGSAILLFGLNTALAQPVDAAVTKIDVNDSNYANKKNELIINPRLVNHVTKIELVSGSAPTTITDNWQGRDLMNSQNVWYNPKGSSMIYWDDFNKVKHDTVVRATFDQVGTYNGKPVSATIEFSDFVGGSMSGSSFDISTAKGTDFSFVELIGSNNKSSRATKQIRSAADFQNLWTKGFYMRGLQSMSVTTNFFDEAGNKVDLNNQSYMTFNSLNPGADPNGEWVHYDSMNKYPYYMRKDGLVGDITNSTTQNLNAMAGLSSAANPSLSGAIEDWNLHHDVMGDPDFTKATASFQTTGSTHKFTVGNTTPNIYHQWFTLSSATLWRVLPDKPTKDVVDSSGKDINKQEIQLGQELSYDINQKIDTLGQDTLAKYQSMVFTDQLDSRLTYTGATLSDSLGNKYDLAASGTISVDSSNKLTYTLNKATLEKLAYVGETLTLHINTKVNSIKDRSEIKNVGHVVLDDRDQPSNEVDNNVPKIDPKVTKKVYDANDQDVNTKALEVGPTYHYNVDSTFDNDFNVKVRSLIDDLDDRLDLKEVKIFKGDKDVTSEGTLTIDDNKESFKWTPKDVNAYAAETVTAKVYFVVNDKKVLTEDKVLNTAHNLKDTLDTPSNQVENTINGFGHVVLIKKDNAGKPVAGVKYTISDTKANMEAGKYLRTDGTKVYYPGDNGYDTAKDMIVTSDSEGKMDFTNLPVYRANKINFVVKEINSGSGHNLDSNIIDVKATMNNSTVINNDVVDLQRVMPRTGGLTILSSLMGLGLLSAIGFWIYKKFKKTA